MAHTGFQIFFVEQDKGTVQRIVNGIMSEEPLLDVNVANDRGKYGHQEKGAFLEWL